MLFSASDVYEDLLIQNNTCEISVYDEVETPNGWVLATELKIGDVLFSTQGAEEIVDITRLDNAVQLRLAFLGGD